mmetsp:Transcript_24820/g.63293  ORF Transcript_24820/g.63293 Transcript_24820/m.63293 type:complete len:296 (+) Transcript_24820:630-1517(+)
MELLAGDGVGERGGEQHRVGVRGSLAAEQMVQDLSVTPNYSPVHSTQPRPADCPWINVHCEQQLHNLQISAGSSQEHGVELSLGVRLREVALRQTAFVATVRNEMENRTHISGTAGMGQTQTAEIFRQPAVACLHGTVHRRPSKHVNDVSRTPMNQQRDTGLLPFLCGIVQRVHPLRRKQVRIGVSLEQRLDGQCRASGSSQVQCRGPRRSPAIHICALLLHQRINGAAIVSSRREVQDSKHDLVTGLSVGIWKPSYQIQRRRPPVVLRVQDPGPGPFIQAQCPDHFHRICHCDR